MSVATALTRAHRGVLACLAAAALMFFATTSVEAQGVTTGAVRGRVLDASGQPLAGATVQLVNRNSGTRFVGATGADGVFYIANVIVGPYMIEARAIGYRPMQRLDVVVTLGRLAETELRLEAVTIEVGAITVTGEADNALLSSSRTGVSTFVSTNLIENLPSISRNFTTFTATNPLVNGNAIAGQNDRFNNLQIDGGTNSDLFALGATNGVPGGRNGSRPLTIEAVQEYQVLIAPFDIRQGGFTGGLINAVTKSGTNDLHGSAFYYVQDDRIVGHDSAGVPTSQFNLRFYGFSLGGPIIRDRLHFFVATEWRSREAPLGGVNISADTTNGRDSLNVGIRYATADRVRQFTIATHGYDPGGYLEPTIPNPDRNLFFKLTGQLGSRSQVELSYNHVNSSDRSILHSPTGANSTRLRDGYQYDGSGFDNASRTNSFRARLNTPISNRITNEVIVSLNDISDVREMGNRRPLFIVGADRRATPTSAPTTFLALGGERFSQANTLDQNILEITNNLTIDIGRHVFTLGGRAERFKFKNVFFPASLGAWFFPDTTAYFAGAPTRYELALPGFYVDSVNGRRDGPIADFTFNNFGLYAQDQWHPAHGLRLTFGVRFDFTNLPEPAYNIRMDTSFVTVGPRAGQRFGVRTDARPTDAVLFSPRFGFNYDVSRDGSTKIRGGVGVFSGRTPYVWASNAYTNTGLEQVQLTCTGTAVPALSADPDAQPTACLTGGLSAAIPSIVYFDQNFKLPQNLRFALGADHRLPWDVVASVDGLFTRALNQFILEDVNLVAGGVSVGEGNRQLYGTISGTSSTATPRRATAAARDVLRQFNSNRDYSYSLTFQLNKRFGNGVEFTAGYTFSHSYDLVSATSDISNSNLNFATLDGTFAQRNLRPSLWDQPHSVRVSGTTNLPWGVRFSLFYTGRSGRTYAYRYGSDVNADGFSGNDLVYVPLNSQDISLTNPAQYAQLDAYINREPCLREQRGQIMQRTSCRNPWQSFVDARATKAVRTVGGQNLELTVSMFNLMSFLGVGGTIRETSGFENIALLNLSRYDSALKRGVYSLALPEYRRVNTFASRWKMEIGARYAF